MRKLLFILLMAGSTFASEDTFNEDLIFGDTGSKSPKNEIRRNTEVTYSPFEKDAYLTSSFGENRGTRYHAGIDYSTNMEEGWPILAPEDGRVKEIRTSPFGYGKVMFFQGKSGKTWVFAHQSSFGKLDIQVRNKQYASHKNDVTLTPNTPYRKGDTLTFSGSSGIGNPHLHLEVRLDKDRVVSPCALGALCLDTIAPQIFAGAIWQGNSVAVTSAEALEKGCMVTPVKNEFGLYLALKIADYSREPKENPMAIRRLEIWRYDEKIYSKVVDTLRYSKMADIRNELVWSEEADTAGDWHYIPAKIAPLSKYTIEVEDFAGNITKRVFTLHPKCNGNKSIAQIKNQTAPVYTFLGKTMLNLFMCRSGYSFRVTGDNDEVLADDLCSAMPQKITTLGRVLQDYPTAKYIEYSANASSTGDGKAINEKIAVFRRTPYQTNVNWKADLGDGTIITQKITGIPVAKLDSTPIAMAVTRTHTDSLDFFEFHPKGLQLKNWNVCVDSKGDKAPLYWLGETTRDWFIFDKQTKGKTRCASANELRDVAAIPPSEEPMSIGYPYWANSYIEGISQPVLKIPLVYKYDGVPNGNAITAKAKGKWIAVEYDSEPRELVLEGSKVPDAGEVINIIVIDEAKRKNKFDVTVPDL